MKKRKKYLVILLVPFVIFNCIFIYDQIKNRRFHQFEKEIKTDFSFIDKIELGNFGPYCALYVYVDEDSCSYTEIEEAFIRIMIEVSSEDNFQYFLERHNRDASGELTFFDVTFYKKGEDDKALYRYSSCKNFQVWKLEGESDKTYNITEYNK